MAKITVLRPDETESTTPLLTELATRRVPEAGATVTLIDNGKPRAREVLQRIAETLAEKIPGLVVEVFSKPSAGKPIGADDAIKMAARSHLVITGVGD